MKLKYMLIVFITVLVLIPLKTSAMFNQDSSNVRHQNSWYCEILGNSLSALSVNYEYLNRISRNLRIGPRVGYGFKTEPITTRQAFPIELIMVYSKNKVHKIEMSLGITYARNNASPISRISYFVGRIGYRYQSNKGFLMRIGFTPFTLISRLSSPNISIDPPVVLMGGISLGYCLKNI